MLVLTRKLGEAVAIGDDIKIIVMQIKGKQVRLGIKADPTTLVHREEVYQKIKDENHSASGIQSDSFEIFDEFSNIQRKESGGQALILRKKQSPT